jgi:hypothetical protein
VRSWACFEGGWLSERWLLCLWLKGRRGVLVLRVKTANKARRPSNTRENIKSQTEAEVLMRTTHRRLTCAGPLPVLFVWR